MPGPLKSLQIAGSHIDIWYRRLDAIPHTEIDILSERERRRAASFYRQQDGLAYSRCRAFLRRVLSAYSSEGDPAALQLTAAAGCKPKMLCIPDSAAVEFSLSHTRSAAMIAVSRDCEVGIDMEDLDRAPSMDGLEGHVLSASERRLFHERSAADRPRLLLDYWVAKEAALKALGLGLSDMKSIEVDLPHKSGSHPTAGTVLFGETASLRGVAWAVCARS